MYRKNLSGVHDQIGLGQLATKTFSFAAVNNNSVKQTLLTERRGESQVCALFLTPVSFLTFVELMPKGWPVRGRSKLSFLQKVIKIFFCFALCILN